MQFVTMWRLRMKNQVLIKVRKSKQKIENSKSEQESQMKMQQKAAEIAIDSATKSHKFSCLRLLLRNLIVREVSSIAQVLRTWTLKKVESTASKRLKKAKKKWMSAEEELKSQLEMEQQATQKSWDKNNMEHQAEVQNLSQSVAQMQGLIRAAGLRILYNVSRRQRQVVLRSAILRWQKQASVFALSVSIASQVLNTAS